MTTKVHMWGVWVREGGHDHQGTHVGGVGEGGHDHQGRGREVMTTKVHMWGVWVREGGHDHQGTLTASLTLLWPTMMTTGGSPMAAHKVRCFMMQTRVGMSWLCNSTWTQQHYTCIHVCVC